MDIKNFYEIYENLLKDCKEKQAYELENKYNFMNKHDLFYIIKKLVFKLEKAKNQ